MAKIAICGYGSQGKGRGPNGEGYTYVVNDNVRTKDIIQVIATSHGKEPKKFATTASPFHIHKENTVKGQEAKQKAIDATGNNPTEVYSGKELGAKGSKAKEVIGIDKDGFEHKTISEYEKSTRAGNIAMYKQQDPNAKWTDKANETFDSYSKQFMNKGEQ